jgi:hypothetical protein
VSSRGVLRLGLLTVVVSALLACASPEAARGRGGGSGADIGNHGEVLQLHDSQRPFYQTPLKAARR